MAPSPISSLQSISKAARKNFIQPALPLTHIAAKVADPATTALRAGQDGDGETAKTNEYQGVPAASTAMEEMSKTDPINLASSIETVIATASISPAAQPEARPEQMITEDGDTTADHLPNGALSADDGTSTLSVKGSATGSMTRNPRDVNGHVEETTLSEEDIFMTAQFKAPEVSGAVEASTRPTAALTQHFDGALAPDQMPTTVQVERLYQVPTNEEKILDWAEESATEAEQLVLSEITSVAQEPLENVNSPSTLEVGANDRAPPRPLPEHAPGSSGVDHATLSFTSHPAQADTGELLTNGDHLILSGPGHRATDSVSNMTNGVPYELDGERPSTALPGAAEEPFASISGHMLRLFMTREWADWSIEVVSTTGQFAPVAYPAHGAVMSRSPILNQKMRDHMLSARMNSVVTLQPPRYLQPPAFEAALKYLYTDTTLSRADCSKLFTLGQAYDNRSSRDYILDCVLTYWLSGLCLGLQEVADQGLAIFQETVDWDTVEVAVRAGLDLKTSVQAVSTTSMASIRNGVSQSNERRKSNMQAAGEARSVGSTIMRVVSDFIARKLSQGLVSFDLDRSQSQVLPSYLPNPQEIARSSRRTSNPVLAGITFGSMPASSDLLSEGSTSPSPRPVHSSAPTTTKSVADRALSAILLGLPFEDLQLVLSEVLRASRNPSSISALFSQVVDEREKRRLQVLGSKLVPNADRKAHPEVWKVVGEKERLIRGSSPEDGCFLQKEKTSFLLSTKTSVSYA